MTTAQIIFSIYIYSLIALYFIFLPKIFKKAGHESWKGYVPGLNLFEWLKVLKQPWWWIFFFIPYITISSIGMLTEGVAFLMIIVLNVSTAKMFGVFGWQDTLKMILLPHWGLSEIAFKDATYVGETDWHNEAFAVVAASIIRSFVFEPFTIPTPSMEKDLLVGDYLFVSKLSYGPKLPNTPLSIPFFHNYIPVINRNSYVEWAKRPYRRLPGIGEVERNEVVVFNFPAGDTAIFDPGVEGLMGHTYAQWKRDLAFDLWLKDQKNIGKAYTDFETEKKPYLSRARKFYEENFGLVFRPVDKRENYIKRCVAVPGDLLEIENNRLLINEELNADFEDMQFQYNVAPAAIAYNRSSLEFWKDEFDLVETHIYPAGPTGEMAGLPLTASVLEAFKVRYPKADFVQKNYKRGKYNLTEREVAMFRSNKSVSHINGTKADQYTFKLNYYWMMGDNRHRSADSRYWGFVPEDHVVGKAVFVWMSIDPEDGMFGGGIRTNRLFTAID